MTAEASQQPVIDFLGDSASHGGLPVKRIDTHAAMVFLAGDRAIKIKRAVRFPFLDFSTLEKRKIACQSEIAVNRAFAPAIYRGVVAITRDGGGGLAIGGKGEPVEWAVEMRRFDESRTLDRLAEAGAVDDTLAEALGRAVAAAHRTAPTVIDANFTDTLAKIIAQNETELAGEPDLFSLQELRALATATRAAFERVKSLLDARERAGLVRRCHGDLHLGNIVLIDGKPVLFDAVEFDDRIATGDVYYDLAFLLMDLIERGLPGAANIVLNRYLTDTQRLHDFEALAALPLFMSVRAAIRAKVTAARRRQGDARVELTQRARAYAALAQKLLAPAKPRLVAVGGLSGTGKSLLARALATSASATRRAPWCSAAMSNERRCIGVAETERLPETAYASGCKRQGLCKPRRKGASRERRRSFGDRGWRLRATRRARRHRDSGRKVPNFRAFSSRPASRPASPASARAPPTHPTPMPPSPACKISSTSGASHGRRLMLRERPRTR